MSKVTLLPLAALLALGLAPLLRAEPPARPLTEADLLKTLDGLGKGDPVTKAPLSAEPALPKAEPAAPPPRAPRAAAATPKPDLLGASTGKAPKSDAPKKDAKDAKDKTPMPGSTAGQTEITSEEAAFDQRTHQAVFTIKVFVRNPDFTLSCDKLTAYMKHDEEKPAKGAAPAAGGANPGPGRVALPTLDAPGVQVTGTPAPTKKGDPTAGGPGSGLDKALAEGITSPVEIIQDKVADDGTISHNVGHGKTAFYDSADGSVTLKGKPDVQQGINSCVALAEETIIVLYRDGHMKTIGPTKNIIRESSGATPAPKSTAGNTNGR